jgi:hypothetical protein
MPRRGLRIVVALFVTLPAGLLLFGPAAMPAGQPEAKSDAARPPAVDPADNSYCLVCHLNYEEEKLTKLHQPQGVGCEKCHGPSVKHSGDEDGLTPPDKLFAKEEILGFCMTCHPQEKLKKEENHQDLFAPEGGSKDTCTDCHGKQHRMKVRTRVWDKKTRKLLSDDGVRMMSKDSPATSGAERSVPKGK